MSRDMRCQGVLKDIGNAVVLVLAHLARRAVEQVQEAVQASCPPPPPKAAKVIDFPAVDIPVTRRHAAPACFVAHKPLGRRR